MECDISACNLQKRKKEEKVTICLVGNERQKCVVPSQWHCAKPYALMLYCVLNFMGDLKSVPFVILNIYDFCLKY